MIVSSSMFASNTENTDCDINIQKVADFTKILYESDKLYVEYEIETTVGEQTIKSNILTISDNKKLLIKNEFFEIYQDEKIRITIIKSQATILIQDINDLSSDVATNPSKTNFDWNGAGMLDSLRKLANVVYCDKSGDIASITAKFPPSIHGKVQPLRSLVLSYNDASGKLLQHQYVYHLHDEHKDKYETINYKKITRNFDSSLLSNNVITKIYMNGLLKRVYQSYQIRDLRKDKYLK